MPLSIGVGATTSIVGRKHPTVLAKDDAV